MMSVIASPHKRRGAILSMELVLILPIFLLLVFAIVEFSMLMSAHTRVANAAQSGARLMSLRGASAEEVRDQVNSLLGASLARNCLIEVHPARHAGDIGRVTVRVPMQNASPDLLWIAGYSLTSRSICADAPMVMERSASTGDPQTL
jgi:Flp pilus assembly protein TadG